MTIVIENVHSGDRYIYPETNDNIETPTGFIQIKSVPWGFIPSTNQDSSGLLHFNHVFPSYAPKGPPT